MDKNQKATQRILQYDLYKGLLMFSVILGHTFTAISVNSYLHIFIRSFDMPFFAFISGYFLRKSCKKREWYKNLKKK